MNKFIWTGLGIQAGLVLAYLAVRYIVWAVEYAEEHDMGHIKTTLLLTAPAQLISIGLIITGLIIS